MPKRFRYKSTFDFPAVAADVTSFAGDVIDGRTGFLCKPGDPASLAKSGTRRRDPR